MKKEDKNFQKLSWFQCIVYLMSHNVTDDEEDQLIDRLKDGIISFFFLFALATCFITFIFILLHEVYAVIIGLAIIIGSILIAVFVSDESNFSGGPWRY